MFDNNFYYLPKYIFPFIETKVADFTSSSFDKLQCR